MIDDGPNKENLPRAKACGRCQLELPITDFGVASHRPDGRNIYCKACVRIIVAEHRQRLKAHKAARQRFKPAPPPPPALPVERSRRVKPSFERRVLEAIKLGKRTRTEIGLQVFLSGDGKYSSIGRKPELQARLLSDEPGVTLNKYEVHQQTAVVSDRLCDVLCSLVDDGVLRIELVDGQAMYCPVENKPMLADKADLLSFNQLVLAFGPRSAGASTRTRRVEKRAESAGLEPPARSRVA